jgi:hypothetical protein
MKNPTVKQHNIRDRARPLVDQDSKKTNRMERS